MTTNMNIQETEPARQAQQPQRTIGRNILRHALGLLAFLVISVVGTIGYVILMLHGFNVGRTGFGLAGAIIIIPIWALALGVLAWLPVMLMHERRRGAMSQARAALFAGVIAFVFSIIVFGPPGFGLRGGAPFLGYAMVIIVILGALAHNAIARRRATS